ncbi:hypothetical protein Ancab_039185 [Ancistrocladus abbreviatus]
MESNYQNNDHNSKSILPSTADEHQLDLYTIPIFSGWFSWDTIHETERISLKEFFDGSSFTRNPRIYKEYRDFIISKYREDPSRRLTFTEVRKSLVGDVCLLKKVFDFLENWGLINFNVAAEEGKGKLVAEGESLRVKVEEGAPNGVRVVAIPNSLKPLVAPPPVVAGSGGGGGVIDNGFKLPPLASYSGAFEDSRREELLCGNCKEKCDSKYYKSTKQENTVICLKCFENGKFGENKSAHDFKLNDPAENKGNHDAGWTEAETLLLLESVLKHGDDWELVAQCVQTKTKYDCISRLLELPFGELMLGPQVKFPSRSTINDENAVDPEQSASSEPQEISKREDDCRDQMADKEQNEEVDPCLKKRRISSDDRSLMKQVALISTMVGPRITTAAAAAAVLALSDGNPLVRDIFYAEDDTAANELRSGNLNTQLEGSFQLGDSGIKEVPRLSEVEGMSAAKSTIPLSLRMRAVVATALGAAAAHARLLADQEEREIEHLMAMVIETQLKKLGWKIKHFEDLERIMEKEHAQLEELKESIIVEQIDILQKIFDAGIPRWRDNALVKPLPGGV